MGLYLLSIFKLGTPFDPKRANLDKVRVIGKAIKVDVVAMPKMTYQELKKMTPPKEQVEVVKEKAKDTGGSDKAILEKATQQKSLKDMLSKFANRNVKTDTKTKQKARPKKITEDTTDYSNIIAAGNKLSDGSSYTGTGSAQAQGDFDNYVISVMEAVRKHWRLPAYLANLELSCHVQVFINSQGKLLEYKIIKSSGNAEYDSKAVGSIRAVGSFPRPKKEITNRLVAGELVLAFPI
ncbi:TonB family C-terminal domain protein [Bacteriovorax sp. BAL6_X]|uniref:TonB family protein n=1 Tax=Bacteriovorax sp. BAL6_X TaxID=1201290 RepID=UPI000385C3A2|nr:TonB family protein [Bacteriovorax sp. BAL6_X]EPZ52230.1 TonB family C-terminal domain protein [Bacteriovorax sp. BAL6_X]